MYEQVQDHGSFIPYGPLGSLLSKSIFFVLLKNNNVNSRQIYCLQMIYRTLL